MTKSDLKQILSVYPKIRNAIIKGKKQVSIIKYRRKKNIEIADRIKSFENYFNVLIKNENAVIAEIIDKAYFQGLKATEIIMNSPISECGYYRIKKSIEEKIYELLIADGFVTKNEIINNVL